MLQIMSNINLKEKIDRIVQSVLIIIRAYSEMQKNKGMLYKECKYILNVQSRGSVLEGIKEKPNLIMNL